MKRIREFFELESAAGILLGLAAILALIMQNSKLAPIYNSLLKTEVIIKIGEFMIDKPLLLWINDGLMAIFFLLVGLELKREAVYGQLASKKKVMLPAIAAVGGLIFPALIYIAINWNNKENLVGWAIPAATDIAFALGVITLFGRKIPEALKVTLVGIAIIDDLAAIIIIAIFYTKALSLTSLALSAVFILIFILLQYYKVQKLAPYIINGIFMWAFVLKSGVHATLAGVVMAMFIPTTSKSESEKSPLLKMEHGLHPWVAYAVLPLFAFANAGVPLSGFTFGSLFTPITLGIILGLFFGKQIGVMLFTYLGVKFKLCELPTNSTWLSYYGMSLVTGIGFTMSLFIGTLAFDAFDTQNAVRIGVLLGSFLSGVLGYCVLKRCVTD